jgi:hypothetical protein
MHIEGILQVQLETILNEWFQSVIDTYPAETARLLKKEKNQFANPVGHTVYYALKGLVEEFFRDADAEDSKLASLLDNIIRIKAIQEFSASEAVNFVFALKPIVRKILDQPLDEGTVTYDDLLRFEDRIDSLGLMAFNIYMRCRENLYEVRITEYKNSTNRLLQRAERILSKSPKQESESEDETI